MVDVQILPETFLNMSLSSACFTDEGVKSGNSYVGTTLLSAGLSELQIIRYQITGSLLYMLYMLPSKYA